VRLYAFHRQGMFYPIQLKDDLDACRNAECNPGTIKVTEEPSGRVVWLHGKRVMKGGVGVVSASSRPAAAETPEEIARKISYEAKWMRSGQLGHPMWPDYALSAPNTSGEHGNGGCRSTRHQRTGARSTSG
jgi:hypothetical protein